MSIGTEITRLANAKSAIATAITNKGVTVPSSTKLDGMATLINSIANQAELESITVKTPPTKLDYIPGDTFDATGLVLTVLVGEVEIDITSGYTITPETMAADTTSVTISYTAGVKTVSTTQAVTMIECDPVLENNTWAKIAEIAAYGKAAQIWSIGDVKQLSIDGTNYPATIVDFGHHDLDSTDTKYGDAEYNSGSNKAGITFWVAGMYKNTKYAMYGSETAGITWQTSTVRTSVMPTIKNQLPTELQAVLRTVRTPQNARDDTADQLFLLSSIEIGSKNGSTTYVKDKTGSMLAYFVAGNERRLKRNNAYDAWWTRTTSSTNAFVTVDETGNLYYGVTYGTVGGVAPAFCL